MKRTDLERIIRAAAAITDENEFIAIGSQTTLGQYPNVPEARLQSTEADIYARNRPELGDLIEGALGELSPFECTFGCRADEVGPDTATLPSGWDERLIPIQTANTGWATGWCLECHDIAIAKYVAGRAKDARYIGDLWNSGLVDLRILEERLEDTAIRDDLRRHIRMRIQRDARTHTRTGHVPDRDGWTRSQD